MANETNQKVKDEDIAFRNESIAAIRGLMNENKTLRDTIAASAKKRQSTVSKSKSSSNKISGLQGLGSPIKLS